LNDITKAYEKNHDLESLLFDDFFNKAIHTAQPGWRRVNAQATLWGIPTPAFSTALAFFDGYRSEIVSANILQAQRDYFGAHTFRVLPGKENKGLPEGKDIRKFAFYFCHQSSHWLTNYIIQTSTGPAVVETFLHRLTLHDSSLYSFFICGQFLVCACVPMKRKLPMNLYTLINKTVCPLNIA
jgi:hypothetical protein